MKLRKMIAAILAVVTLSICVQPCFAATIEELIVDFPETANLQLPMEVSAKKSDGGNYESGGLLIENITSAQKVDYKASLDMQPVREVFENPVMDALANSDDAQLKNEFLNGTVTTEITVVIDYPDTAETTSDFRNKGALVSDNNIFEEKSRDVDEATKRAVIKFKNKDNTKVSQLIDNQSTYFEDLAFVLEDEVQYSLAGEHTVSITLSGSTVIDFASRDQVFSYNGQASHIVTVTTKMEELTHLLKVVPAVPPTCFEDGKTEGVICSIHNKYCPDANGVKVPVTIGRLNHKVGTESKKMHIDGVSPTCTEEGILEHWTCVLCKSDFATESSDVVVPHENHIIQKLPHTPRTIPGVSPTCKDHGYADGSECSVCGLIIQYSVLIPATGNHVEVPIKTAVPADCETSGTTAGIKCSVCDTIIEEAITLPPTGHNYGEWVVTQEATATAEGSKERTCQNNPAHKEVIAIPKTQQHTHSIDPNADVIIKAADCKHEGKKQQYCSCGEAMGEPVVIPKLPHALTHVDAVEANCVSKGNIEYWVCGRQGCGKTFRDQDAKHEVSSVKIKKDKENHVEIVDIPGIAATCAIEGLTVGKKCKACNKITVKQQTIPMTSCYNADPAKNNLKEIPAVPAKCEENGMKLHWHCEVCNRDYGDAQGTIIWKEKDYFIPATGHDYAPAEKIDPAATPDADGNFEAIKVCRNDPSHKQELKMPAEQICTHKVVEIENGESHITDKIYTVVVKEPTCLEEGKSRKICHLCGYVAEDNIPIPKLKHDLEYISAVPSDCHSEGTEAYWKCKLCDKLFDAKDSTKIITAPKKIAKITEHSFEDRNENLKVCRFCGEKVHVNKKDKDGNDVGNNGANLVKPAHIKDGENDEEIKENKKVDEVREVRKKATVDNYVIFEQKEEVSKEIDENIQANKPAETAEVQKLVYDIDVEKVTTYDNGAGKEDKNIQDIKETEDLVIIRIDIPVELRTYVDFLVHRLHEGRVEIIRKTPNADGEFIEISEDKSHVILHVKKFSEYAVVAYDTVVNVPEYPSSSGGGSSLGALSYTIKINANGGIAIDSIKVNKGETIVLPIPTREGYVFAGWYTDNEFKNKFDPNTKIERNLTLYAKWIESVLNADNHIAYINGYPAVDGVEEVRPENNITREEIATIFYRLLADDVRNELYTTSNSFTDVKADRWSNEYISTMANGGYVNGYEDGSFKPAGAITRAEFVTIAARLYGSDEGVAQSDVEFGDIDGHWAANHIKFATSSGWIDGYDDGTFRPNKSITRAEVMKIINNMLNRHVNEEGLVDGIKQWADNKSDAWYYYDVIEATNAHSFERAEGIKTETWTGIVEK